MSLIVSVLPTLFYLLVLKAMDSFALARFKLVMRNVLIGVLCCAVAFVLTNPACLGIPVAISGLSLMPLIEEIMKGFAPARLTVGGKFRFMAQSLVYGAAIGSGFALLENVIYFYFNPAMSLGTAIVRGFGCAILHMGCTAMFSTLLLLLYKSLAKAVAIVLAFIPSVFIHFAYNLALENELVSPAVALALVVAAFICFFIILFICGEKRINVWMDRSINSDIQILSAIRSGNFKSTKAGEFLLTVREQFPPEVFFDMLCYYQLFLELKISKQSEMLLSQAGLSDVGAEDRHSERNAKKAEMKSLAASIGRTGMMILAPLVKDNI